MKATDRQKHNLEMYQATPLGGAAVRETALWREQSAQEADAIRLLKIVTIFAPGGTEGQVHNLVRCMDRERFDLHFACLKKWGYYLEEVQQWGIPVTEFRIRSLYKPHALMQMLRLAEHMRAQRIQIAHSYNFYSNTLAIPAAKLAGVPVVLASVRDRGVYLTPAQRRVQKWVLRLADKVLVNADSIRDWLMEDGLDEGRIVTIRNGIDLSRFRDQRRQPSFRSRYGIPDSAPLVVMLSRLNPQKGVGDFMKAAAQVSRQFPEARFLLVGERLHHKDGVYVQDQAYHDSLVRLAGELGLGERLIFTGHVNDVPGLLAETDISVLPSHSEGLPNSLLEAMAAGVPVVATRVGGIPELIRDGENGFLVAPGAPGEVAAAIIRLLRDEVLTARFRQAALERAERHFSLQRVVQDTQALYEAELASKRGSTKE